MILAALKRALPAKAEMAAAYADSFFKKVQQTADFC